MEGSSGHIRSNFLGTRRPATVARIDCIADARAVTKTLHNCFVSAVNFASIPLEHWAK